jgi:hypothetical protein
MKNCKSCILIWLFLFAIIFINLILLYKIYYKPLSNIREYYTTDEWTNLNTEFNELLERNKTQVLDNYPLLLSSDISNIKTAFS